MQKIVIYEGDAFARLLSSYHGALLSIGPDALSLSVKTRKVFSEGAALQAWEQLKRWISTGAFSLIILEHFTDAFSALDEKDVSIWLKDHSSEPDFPSLVMTGNARPEALCSFIPVFRDEDEVLEYLK